MRKKILIGSIFVLTLLLLMPSIPALQMNNINNRIKQDYKEITLDDISDLNLSIKHPMLFFITYGLLLFRTMRFEILWEFSTEPYEWGLGFEVVHPLVFIRSVILLFSAMLRFEPWAYLSEIYGWGWFE